MKETTIQAAFQDETFVKGLFAMETPEEVQAALRGRGVEMTVGEIVKLRDSMAKRQAGGPLSDHELESVAGGADNNLDGILPSWNEIWLSISSKW
jgi:hypothetical protein